MKRYIALSIAVVLNFKNIIEIWIQPSFLNAQGEESTYVVPDLLLYMTVILIFTILMAFYSKKIIWITTFSLALLLSVFSFIYLISSQTGFEVFSISFEIVSLSLLILHLVLNADIILKSLEIDEESKLSKNNEASEKNVLSFKKIFSKKTCKN